MYMNVQSRFVHTAPDGNNPNGQQQVPGLASVVLAHSGILLCRQQEGPLDTYHADDSKISC